MFKRVTKFLFNRKSKEEELVLQFVPSLIVILQYEEEMKGSPLTEAEVLEIRDRSTCISVPKSAAIALEESRGRDIDPENCWEKWCIIRKEE